MWYVLFSCLCEEVSMPGSSSMFCPYSAIGFLFEGGCFMQHFRMLFPSDSISDLEVSQIYSSLNNPYLSEVAR